MKNFQNALKEYGSKEKEEVKDWLDAFSLLKKLLESDLVYRDSKTKKRIIFLDELPWMDTPRSDFKAALDLFWNTYASSQNDIILKIVFCTREIKFIHNLLFSYNIAYILMKLEFLWKYPRFF